MIYGGLTQVVGLQSERQIRYTNKTISNHIDYLADAFLISKASRYDIKGRKYIGANRKYYFTDMSLRNARLNFRQQEPAHIMENIVYNELLIRGYNVNEGVVEIFDKNKEGKCYGIRYRKREAIEGDELRAEEKKNNRKLRFYDRFCDILIIGYKVVKNGRTHMKIIIINGSARKGNTLTAIDAFIKGASEKNEIEVIEPDKLQIAPCKGCGVCQCHKGCVDNDDTNPTIDKIAAADMILFTTPVYWWGMSAQLKLVIDKCYCRGLQMKNKKVGVIAVGGSPVDSIQYELINKQFDCMADYLSWDMLFQKSYYANEKTDLAKDENSLKELEDIGKNL